MRKKKLKNYYSKERNGEIGRKKIQTYVPSKNNKKIILKNFQQKPKNFKKATQKNCNRKNLINAKKCKALKNSQK